MSFSHFFPLPYTAKIPMTPPGIESATFRFVAKYLNHCATGGTNVAYIWKDYVSVTVTTNRRKQKEITCLTYLLHAAESFFRS
jgi:hypothetical protein